MSATATLATSVHSLCLFPKHQPPKPPQQQQQQLKQVSIDVDDTRGGENRHRELLEPLDDASANHQTSAYPETQPESAATASTTPALSPPASSLKERLLDANANADDPEAAGSSRQSDYATDSSWPRAVDALAQRLWDCGRDPLRGDFSSPSSSSASSLSLSSSKFLSATQMESAMTASFKLSAKVPFTRCGVPDNSDADADGGSDKYCDEDCDVLCDGPYVHVSYAVASPEMPTSASPSKHTITLHHQRQQQQQRKPRQQQIQRNSMRNNHQTWQQNNRQQPQIMQGRPLTLRRAPQTPPAFPATIDNPLYLAPMSAPETKSLHQSPRVVCDRLQLIHYQPMINPFKTIAKSATASPTAAYSQKPIVASSQSSSSSTMDSPPSTANSATDATVRAEKKTSHYFSNPKQRELLPSLVSPMSLRRPIKRHHYESDDIPQLPAMPSPLPQVARLAAKHGCVHCKRGNFLEFCFVGDRCICKCHSECPCNPCTNIRTHRSSLSSSSTQSSFFSNNTAAVGETVHARRSVVHAATAATPTSVAAIATGCHT